MKRAHGRRVHCVFSNDYCILLEATHRGQGVCNAQLRISESKDISNPLISCGFGSELRVANWPQKCCGFLNRRASAVDLKFLSW
jgi:hypothetical protein